LSVSKAPPSRGCGGYISLKSVIKNSTFQIKSPSLCS
jgi:hypothetical protein